MAVIRNFQNVSHVSKEGNAPVYVTFYLGKDKVVIPCNLSVPVKSWDKRQGKVLTNEKNHKDYNLCIEKVRSRINDIMVKYRLEKKILNKELFLREYARPNDFDTFYAYFEYYIKKHRGEIEPTTLDVHIDAINKMRRYDPILSIGGLTEEWIKNYKIYLKRKIGNKDSTINKNMACIKKYCRAAIKEGYMMQNPFENIKVKSRTTSGFAFLTEEELNILTGMYKSHELTDNYHKVLEFFLFMCFSSLHITDAKRIRIEHISPTSFTYYRVKNRNSKPDPILIPLSSPLKTIINNASAGRKKGLLFENMIADQKINEYIKTIAQKAGINKKLSCKAGRHTFATLFLQKTKDLATLKEILGHTDYRETLVYAHVMEESKQEGVSFFNTFAV